tara:strand:- start:5013 stop:5291 length:279 start_codon:yes stop_codon:yes gene_type:complete
MNKELQDQIINFKKKEVLWKWENYHGERSRWYKYDFRFVKKYNNNCATNLGCGKKQFLSKDDLLIWCEINNIKCAKSKKYSDIVKLLIKSLC